MNVNNIKAIITDCDGTLTDGYYEYHHDGSVSKQFNTRDMYALQRMENLGYRVYICTGASDPATKFRFAKIQKEILIAKRDEFGNEDKVSVIETILERDGFTWDNVAYIGDAENDLGPLSKASLSACPRDAIPEAKDLSNFITDACGGRAAFYEFARYICKESGIKWIE